MASTLNRRLELHSILESICENCYFDPPTNKKLKYPCIKYNRINSRTFHGDNIPYIVTARYLITVIDDDPDSDIVPEIEKLPMCTFDRTYTTDNLHHSVFTIYF